MVRACLVDVYDTILTADYSARVDALTAFAGADPAAWLREWGETDADRGLGKLSMADAVARTLRACGIEPRPALVGDLVRLEADLLREGARLYDDTVVFFGKLRSRGILTALVSNCSPHTRQMLEHLGVVALADSVILSCEVGWLKPSPEIYQRALTSLGVGPADALMIDDHARFCAGAEAVGMRAIQIARPGLGKPPPPDLAFPVVRSLMDVPQLL
jgi:putative hydrolase of the HAD superfamily